MGRRDDADRAPPGQQHLQALPRERLVVNEQQSNHPSLTARIVVVVWFDICCFQLKEDQHRLVRKRKVTQTKYKRA
jgi:hypothetical protein